MRYEFRTTVGTFWITQRPWEPDLAVLGIDEITLGAYESAAAAAADVSSQHTGWEEWDNLQEVSKPHDISDWEEAIDEGPEDVQELPSET